MISDKRIIKTRNGIKTAFMQLLLEKELGRITVSTLAEKAQINRSTFYLHYADINAIMKDIETEIETDISACISSFDIDSVYESTFATLTAFTELLNEKPDMKNFILDSTSSDYLTGRIKEILVDRTKAALMQTYKFDENDIVYPLTFAAGGIIDAYVKWSHSDKTISLKELIKTVSVFTQHVLEYIKTV